MVRTGRREASGAGDDASARFPRVCLPLYSRLVPASRRKVRELALQVLFVWDANASNDALLAAPILEDPSAGDEARRAASEMAAGAWNNREAADKWVERLAPQWPPRRQPGVDRNLLRMAVYEMTHTDTPPKVVIDEAIELAKAFSTENSPSFVNGVLDAVLKEHTALTSGSPNDETRNQNQ